MVDPSDPRVWRDIVRYYRYVDIIIDYPTVVKSEWEKMRDALVDMYALRLPVYHYSDGAYYRLRFDTTRFINYCR